MGAYGRTPVTRLRCWQSWTATAILCLHGDPMPKRNLTHPDATPDWSLSEQQRTAIQLIVSGKNFQTVADAIAVQRPTVSHWVHHHPGFQAELNRCRQELWADLVDG